MADADKLLEQIRANGDEVWVAGPQPEAAIDELETVLRIAMPPSYREFLETYGGMKIFDTCISGIIDGKALGLETGWLYGDTLRCRADNNLPHHLLVIQADEDAPYCLVTNRPKSGGEFPLVSYDLETGDVERLADSFGTWFMKWLRFQAEE
jgi:SMI1-KNR4 cell-wall